MYPFTNNKDYLQLKSHRTCEDEGVNYINVGEEWHNLDDITFTNTYVHPDTWETVQGMWYSDGGDNNLDASVREKRNYCRKGKATFTFTGTCLVVRIFAQPLYGNADVKIDGVKPSELADVVEPIDVLECDAYEIDGTWGNEYVDITICNGIADAEHTVNLYCDNDDAGLGGWWVIAGYKVAEYDNKTGERPSYIMDRCGDPNKEELTIINEDVDWNGVRSIVDISLDFGSFFVDQNGDAIGVVNISELWTDQYSVIDFWPDIQGDEEEQTFDDTFLLTASYEDPDGVIEKVYGQYYIHHTDDETLMYENGWTADGSFVLNFRGRLYYYPCAITYGDNHDIRVHFFGTWVKVQVYKLPEFFGGWLGVYVDGDGQGEASCSSGGDFPYSVTYSFSGFSNDYHELKLVSHVDDDPYAEACTLLSVEWYETRTYTEAQETITYNWPAVHVPPFAPENPRFLTYGDKNPTCDPVNLGNVDWNIPRDNSGVDALWLEKRPATFAVCYKAGYEDILKTYDIVISEPKALTRAIVEDYQAMGVKVLCYQSYGEEVGTYENEWDAASSTVPYTGDGQGVGGYASYYNKGGNQFGECSECKHDRRRLENIEECAKGQTTNYDDAKWAGRCSAACTKDCRSCYSGYILGWNCAGGHNKNNYYSRTATRACTNSSCPDYTPVHGGCQLYETPDETMYGQDFSMFTTWWPDENGIWKSFYTNPLEPAWNERLKNHYLSVIFDEGVEYTETVTVDTLQTGTAGVTVDGFKITNIPIDSDETVSVTHVADNFEYVRGQDFVFDSETGVVKVQVSSEGAPEAPWGTELSITYTRKGLQADGIFLDTLDTVDVYTSEEYQQAMVDIIAEHHRLYPDKTWVMNRGFTILERLMPFTDMVMFESFITNYNWNTETYYEITDEAELAAVQVFIDQLFALREIYTFNVLGLNYCADDDDAMKQTIAEGVRQYGWLSWNSTISLNDPQENTEIFTKDLYISSNAWRLEDVLDLP